MEIRKTLRRFREFGGWRLVRAYWHMDVLGTAMAEALKMLLGRTSKDAAYERVQRKLAPRFYRQYHPLLIELKRKYTAQELPHDNCGRIWFCWLQGMEAAPDFVKTCLCSLRRNIPEREAVVVTLDNYRRYTALPADIEEKFRQGKMPPALFSDLLRLALLCDHGGTWMDASVLCTGHNFPDRVLACDLFLFQVVLPCPYRFRGLSNWFITSCSHNPLLLTLRDMLFHYWHTHDYTLNYYLFHQFFGWLAQEFPDEVAAMPRGNRLPPLRLGSHLADSFDAQWWEQLTSYCAFHKVNYREAERVKNHQGTVYAHIVKTYPPTCL